MPESCSTRRPVGRLSAAALVPALGLVAALSCAPALAQYKWVAADGTVTYGDRPPPGARPLGQPGAVASAAAGSGASERSAQNRATGAPDTAGLPYELRLAAQRHPVTLYVTNDCQPCELARAHLVRRGIPYSAREVRTAQDAEAFRSLGFAELSFPAIAVGRDRTVGFEPGGWDRMFDAAGYPKTSKLPARWQAAQAEPLTAPETSRLTVQVEAPLAAGQDVAQAAGQDASTMPATAETSPSAARSRASASASSASAAAPEPTIRF